MKELRSLKELMYDYRNDHGNATNGHSAETETLEAIIVQASQRFCQVMKDIGNDDLQENKDQLCKGIQSPEEWKERMLR